MGRWSYREYLSFFDHAVDTDGAGYLEDYTCFRDLSVLRATAWLITRVTFCRDPLVTFVAAGILAGSLQFVAAGFLFHKLPSAYSHCCDLA